MALPIRKPLVVTAPVLDSTPAVNEYGQLVRHVGPIDAVITGGVVSLLQPSSSVITKIPLSLVSVVLAVADGTRMGLTIYNDSSKPLFVRVGTGPATLDNWTVKLRKDDYYELPHPAFVGEVTGIWGAAGTGQARVTTFTEP